MKHPYSVSENILKFLNEEKMCDITLVASDGKRIPAHRLILSTATDYFGALFSTALGDHSKPEVEINNIDGTTLDVVVKCFYTGEIEINEFNLEALLAAASFFLFPYLEEKCTEFLVKRGLVDKTNCLRMWALSRLYEFDDLKGLALPLVLRHFRELVQCDEYNRLNYSDLMELLDNDALQVDSEEDVFKAIVDWVQFDLIQRKSEFPNLVRNVRAHLLSSAFIIERVLSVYKQFDCAEAFLSFDEPFLLNKHKCERKAIIEVNLIAIDTANSKAAIELYCGQSKQWSRLDNVTIDYPVFRAVLVDKTLILVGGGKQVFSIDMVTKTQKSLQPMVNTRINPSTITHGGFMYCIGGDYGRTVERYDIKSDKWRFLPSMLVARDRPAIAIYLGKIFVIGGSSNNGYESTVESYDPSINRWTTIVSMNKKRRGADAGESGGYLYVVGGSNGINGSAYLASIERYDPQTCTWNMIKHQLSEPRCYFGMSIIQEWIIVAGGCNEGGTVGETCEKLNLLTGEREDFPSMLEGKTKCQLLLS